MSEKCWYNPSFNIPKWGWYIEKDSKPFPSKEPLERWPNWEYKEKIVKSPFKISKWEDIDISWRKFWVLWESCKLHINKWKFRYDKNKNTILIEIEDWKLKKWDQVIKINNLHFYNEDDILKDKDDTIFFDFIKIKLDDRMVTYENWKVEVEKRKKWIVWVIKWVSKKVFNIRNK